MFKIYMLILLLAHILGDFYFQTKDLAENKNKIVIKLVQHIIIYFIVSVVTILPVFSVGIFKAVVILSMTHGAIDFVKYLILNPKKLHKKSMDSDRTTYLLDQALHFTCIVVTAYILTVYKITIVTSDLINQFFSVIHIEKTQALSWIIMLLFIFKPSNISIKKILSGYKPYDKSEDEDGTDKKTGGFIGALERLIILFLLSINQFSAIGLVLTAKSVARYSKITEDKNFAEYYLLGTLLSTVLVIGIYMAISY